MTLLVFLFCCLFHAMSVIVSLVEVNALFFGCSLASIFFYFIFYFSGWGMELRYGEDAGCPPVFEIRNATKRSMLEITRCNRSSFEK